MTRIHQCPSCEATSAQLYDVVADIGADIDAPDVILDTGCEHYIADNYPDIPAA